MDEESAYFSKWNKFPAKNLLKAPSYVQAIINCVDRQRGHSTATLVCRQGEIMALSSQNLSTVEWSSSVGPPVGQDIAPDRFQIEYAAFDSVTESFLFVLHSPGDKEIYWASRRSLMDNAEKSPVRLQVLISSQQNKNRSFCGIAVDSDRRVVYTCNYEVGTIDLWLLSTSTSERDNEKSITASLIGAINCRDSEENSKIEPWYCAIFFLPAEQNENSTSGQSVGKLYLAVSDWESSSVLLYINSDRNTAPFSAHTVSRGEHVADMGFRHVSVIANASDECKEVGTVTFPHEMCFDCYGNLLVADAVNDRLQIFKLGDGDRYEAVWASDCACYHDRAIFFRDTPSKRYIGLANHFENVICYE